MKQNALLADAEIAEDHVENILDVDTAGQPPQRMRRQPQLLGHQFLTRPSRLPGALLKKGFALLLLILAVELVRH